MFGYYYIGFSDKVFDFYANITFPFGFSEKRSFDPSKGDVLVNALDDIDNSGVNFDELNALVASTDFCLSSEISKKIESLNFHNVEFHNVKFDLTKNEFCFVHVYNSFEFIDFDNCEYLDEDERLFFPGMFSKMAVKEDCIIEVPLEKRLIIREPNSSRVIFHESIVRDLESLGNGSYSFYSISEEYRGGGL